MGVSSRKLGLINAILILAIGLFSFDLYNPSLPSMMENLHISYSALRAIAVVFLVGVGLSQLLFGPLSDQFGRKRVATIALILLLLANLATTTSQNMTQLLAYRFIAGFGSGGCAVIARAILCDISPNTKLLTQALTMMAIGAQVSPAFAPVIGGYIEQYFTWRDNFFTLALLSLLALLFFIITFKESNQQLTKINYSTLSKGYIALLIKKPLFVCYGVIAGLNDSLFISYCTISPLLYQKSLSLSPAMNGLTYTVIFLSVFLGPIMLRRVINKTSNYHALLWLANLCYLSLFIIMWIIGQYYFSVAILLLFGFFVSLLDGFSWPIISSLSLQQFNKNQTGLSSSSYGMLKMLTTALFTALFLHIHVTDLVELSRLFMIMALVIVLLTAMVSYLARAN